MEARPKPARLKKYFTTYKNVLVRKDVLAYTRRHGHIVNMFGRRRRFPEGILVSGAS